MRRMKKTQKQDGVALVITLIVLLVLSTLAAALIFVTNTEVWATANYKTLTQARYSAEAGAQMTENWLIYNYVAPTTYTSYTMTTNPVQYNGKPVVLSATSSVTSNIPPADAAQQTAFSAALSARTIPGVSNATFATYATLVAMTPTAGTSWASTGTIQTWQITTVGNIAGPRPASVQVVETIQRGGTPIFNYGLETISNGCASMNFASSDSTDSYNSSVGPYGVAGNVGTGGNVASNGNVTVSSGAKINGVIAAGNGTKGACPNGLTDSSSTNYNGFSAIPAPLVAPLPWGCMAQPCYPPGTIVLTNQNISTGCATTPGCTKGGIGVNGTGAPVTSESINDGGSTKTVNVFTLAPGSYGNITINGADVVHVSAGTYNINSINFATDGQFVIDSGPVTFNMVGNCASGCPTESGLPAGYSKTEIIYGSGYAGFNGCANAVTANPNVYGATTCGSAKSTYSGVPSNLSLVYGGTETMRLGGMPNALVLYSPAAGYYTPGAPVGLYGSAVVGMFNDSSGSPFHYDTALQQNLLQPGPWHVVSFTWSKF